MLLDFSNSKINLSTEVISKLCHRKFGIGSDGLLVYKNSNKYDFEMIYYNADGSDAGMCGNGGRAMAHFASNKLKKEIVRFNVNNDVYLANVNQERVKLEMSVIKDSDKYDLTEIRKKYNFLKSFYINTGCEHACFQVEDISNLDVNQIGKEIRNHSVFNEHGANVNFYSVKDKKVILRTFEKGVEAETLACGTGALAVAISEEITDSVELSVKGGKLEILFENNKAYLCGDVSLVFSGKMEI